MRSFTCVLVVVYVARKLRPCPSYSRRRDRINLGLWRSLDKGGGGGRRLGRRKQIFGNPFPFGNVPCKLVPKTVSHTPYTTGTLHPHNLRVRIQVTIIIRHICPRGKHGCAVKFHFSESEQNVPP